MARRLPLSKLHISNRLQWARNHMVINGWLSFSVMKKVEPRWTRWEYKILPFSWQSGGGSAMVWAAFGFNGQVGLAFLDGRHNSKYIETLENHLMPFAENIGVRNWEYQHDNAPIHTSNATKNYLNSKNVTAFTQPLMSPDLNPN
ncbi:hypothetical protein AVEN_163305-1 [Araneus ventricosus]|uniref:Transposable element Tc3 transposase n=1 Tax=Araneus ventricosus TaxID=182803 RepID=A0A4Y2N5D3_ARAVE|nr:hypothetical protein AVEN_163305-1 [Araneus ventricosus]